MSTPFLPRAATGIIGDGLEKEAGCHDRRHAKSQPSPRGASLMSGPETGGPPGRARDRPAGASVPSTRLLEPWFAPVALVNGSAVGLVPIVLPIVAIRSGVSPVLPALLARIASFSGLSVAAHCPLDGINARLTASRPRSAKRGFSFVISGGTD